MARKKVKLQWIVNDTARRTTYKKRVKGLMKKAQELSVLCGVQACAVVYSSYDPQPEVWPSPMEAARVLSEFKCRPDNDQTKKRLNQENFTLQRLIKAKDQLVKQQKKNRKMEMANLIHHHLCGQGLQDLNIMELSDLSWSIDEQLKAIIHRMEYFPGAAQEGNAPVAVPDGQETSLEMALESLENQMFTDPSPKPHENVVNVGYPGGQVSHDRFDEPSFWGAPFFV